MSTETREEWRALEAEVGIGCRVIDHALENAAAINAPTSRWQKGNRFYNIYNTAPTAWLADWRRVGLPRTRCCVSARARSCSSRRAHSYLISTSCLVVQHTTTARPGRALIRCMRLAKASLVKAQRRCGISWVGSEVVRRASHVDRQPSCLALLSFLFPLPHTATNQHTSA
ncbi:hypothetical protein H4582DRAFT_1535239 [Lactarius indigo]|nr:hypothetical protein H4582DRAFT_1535239 [Lactarius indigo]